jgi:hypothetical protein
MVRTMMVTDGDDMTRGALASCPALHAGNRARFVPATPIVPDNARRADGARR